MNNKFIIFLFFTLSACILSCEKSSSIEDYEARAVVEAYLSAGDSIQIYITKEILLGSPDTVAEPITGLTVKMTTENQIINLVETEAGIYTSPIKIIANKNYTLSFKYNDADVTANTSIPSSPTGHTISANELAISQVTFGGGFPPSGGIPSFPDPTVLTWANDDNSFYLTTYINTDTIQDPIFSGGPAFRGRGRLVFNRPTQSTTAQIESRQFQYYGLYHVSILHVQPEYAALYETSGTSSINLAPPPTNIENGLGIFTGYAGVTFPLLVKKK